MYRILRIYTCISQRQLMSVMWSTAAKLLTVRVVHNLFCDVWTWYALVSLCMCTCIVIFRCIRLPYNWNSTLTVITLAYEHVLT